MLNPHRVGPLFRALVLGVKAGAVEVGGKEEALARLVFHHRRKLCRRVGDSPPAIGTLLLLLRVTEREVPGSLRS